MYLEIQIVINELYLGIHTGNHVAPSLFLITVIYFFILRLIKPFKVDLTKLQNKS